MVNIRKLSNGIRVVLEEIPYVRSISFGIWVKTGSRNENANNNGASHFIEHLMFKGTYNRSAKDIAEEMDAIGGHINAYTTKEYTCYHTRTLDKHFNIALEVMSDMFLNSKFSEEDINKERNVILEEIDMYDDSPEDLVHDKLQEFAWDGSSLGMPILGTKTSVGGLNSEIIRQYYNNNYTTENTVLAVVGNFKEEEMLLLLEKYFGNWISGSFNCEDTKTEYFPVFVKNEKDIEQIHLCISFKGLERDSEDKYILTVLNTIFGGGMSSRLFQRVREENGLTYSIYSYISGYSDTGIFSIYAGMNPNQLKKVTELIFDEIEILRNNEIPERILKKTKEQIISNFILGTESLVNRMSSSGGAVLLRNNVRTQEEIIADIEKITNNDIKRVFNNIFDYDNLSVSIVGRLKNIDIEDIIKGSIKKALK